jgi:hypothetical protein
MYLPIKLNKYQVNSDSTITIGITLEGIALLGGSISSITLNILNGQKLLVGYDVIVKILLL